MRVPNSWMVDFMENPKWRMTGGTPMTQEILHFACSIIPNIWENKKWSQSPTSHHLFTIFFMVEVEPQRFRQGSIEQGPLPFAPRERIGAHAHGAHGRNLQTQVGADAGCTHLMGAHWGGWGE